MTRPLTKRNSNGELYTRPPDIEKSISIAITQDLKTLTHRIKCLDKNSPEYIPTEALVHLIRNAVHARNQDSIGSLLPALLKRCEKLLQHKISGNYSNADFIREEILSELSLLFAKDQAERCEKLDYFEVRFNNAFKALRISFLRKFKTTQKEQATEMADFIESPEDGAKPSLIQKFLTVPPNQENNVFRSELNDAIKLLPENEQKVIVLHHCFELKIESDDPNEMTVATHCGVTGKTVRNRLRAAEARLAQSLKEAL